MSEKAQAQSPSTELAELGRALGGLRFVHGPGGNVSVKTSDGKLWVKASGARLSDIRVGGSAQSLPTATAEVDTAIVRAALAGDAAADRVLFDRSPRPSLETYFHVLGGTVVAHTHSLGVLLHACSNREPTRLEGVVEIPYIRPGRGIAEAMQSLEASDGEMPSVVLRSHGVVVYADSAQAAIARTMDIDGRLAAPFGKRPSFDALVASYFDGPQKFLSDETRSLGVFQTLPQRAGQAPTSSGYLFPDAVVFASRVFVPSLATAQLEKVARHALSTLGRAAILTDGERRVAIAPTADRLRSVIEVAAAHDWVEDALYSHATPCYLPDDEPAGILGLPSEQYRMALQTEQVSPC